MISRPIDILFILLWCCLCLFPDGQYSGHILSTSLLIHNIFYCYKCIINKNGELCILYLFMIMFSIPPFEYYVFKQSIIEYYFDAVSSEYIYAVTLQLFLFHIVFPLSLDFKHKQQLQLYKNNFIYVICLAITMYCIVASGSGGSIFSEGGYRGALESGSRDSLLAYGMIFLMLSMVSAHSRVKRNLVYVVSLIYIAKNLLYGGRIETMSLCIAIYSIRFQYIISLKRALLLAFLGFCFMTFWGIMRQSGNLEVGLSSEDLAENATANDVFYSSMRVYFLLDYGYLDFTDRLMSFLNFLLSAVMPVSSPLANLSTYMIDYYNCGGGGLISTYFYIWGGYLGIIFLALVLSKLYNLGNKNNSSFYMRFYVVLLLAMAPRWFAYYPIQIIKYCLYGVIIAYILNTISKKVYKNNTLCQGFFK